MDIRGSERRNNVSSCFAINFVIKNKYIGATNSTKATPKQKPKYQTTTASAGYGVSKTTALGSFWSFLEVVWDFGSFWRVLDGVLELLGGLGGPRGGSWRPLGSSWGRLGRSWGHLESPGVEKVVLDPLWSGAGADLCSKWGPRWGPCGNQSMTTSKTNRTKIEDKNEDENRHLPRSS